MSPRRATHFLLLRQKKVSKEKATLLSVTPTRSVGATCDARAGGVPWNSLRACGAPFGQPRQARARSMRVLRHACPPPALRFSARTEGNPGSQHPNGSSLRSAPRGAGALRRAASGRAQRWPAWFLNPLWLRLWRGACGVACASERACLRRLTRRGCSNVAAQQRSEFHGAPRKRTVAGLPLRDAKGSQTWGRLLLPSFLGETRKEGAPPGAHPGLRLQRRLSGHYQKYSCLRLLHKP